jgi:peptidoglycan hydrolase-like protein with peptidoglycan-binding domain
MKSRARWTLAAFTAAGLVLAGTTGVVYSGAGSAPSRGNLAAEQSAAPSVNLDNCPTLTKGYHGGCVSQLQTELNADDNADLTVDGTFGAATQQAVIAFQQDHGVVPAAGIVGPQTKAALDGATPAGPVAASSAPTAPAAPSTPAGPLQYAALGDSYSSGEGLAPFLAGSDTAADTCHRSAKAYSQYVTPKPDVFVACSGQEASAITTAAIPGLEPAQDSQLNQNTGLITLTIGGNDADWTSALTACVKVQGEIIHNTVLSSPADCSQQLSELPGRIETMKENLITAYTDLLTRAPNAQVRVLNYPPLIPDRGGSTSGCRIGRIDPFQLVIAHDVEQQFVALEQQANTAIADAVSQVQSSAASGNQLQLVDVDPQFGGYSGHTISCGDTGRPTPWINALRMSPTQAGALTEDAAHANWNQFQTDLVGVASFHPTEEGQHQMYLALAPELPSGWR